MSLNDMVELRLPCCAVLALLRWCGHCGVASQRKESKDAARVKGASLSESPTNFQFDYVASVCAVQLLLVDDGRRGDAHGDINGDGGVRGI
jgi:hypothetical protein